MKKKAEPAGASAANGSRMSAEAADLVRKALQDEASGLDRMGNARACILKLLARIDRFSGQIDAAFAGQAFMPHLPPDAPRNVRRAKTYIRFHSESALLLGHAIRLLMLSYGMKPEDDWTPVLVEQMRLQYAERKNQSAVPTSGPARAQESPKTAAPAPPQNCSWEERYAHVPSGVY